MVSIRGGRGGGRGKRWRRKDDRRMLFNRRCHGVHRLASSRRRRRRRALMMLTHRHGGCCHGRNRGRLANHLGDGRDGSRRVYRGAAWDGRGMRRHRRGRGGRRRQRCKPHTVLLLIRCGCCTTDVRCLRWNRSGRTRVGCNSGAHFEVRGVYKLVKCVERNHFNVVKVSNEVYQSHSVTLDFQPIIIYIEVV